MSEREEALEPESLPSEEGLKTPAQIPVKAKCKKKIETEAMENCNQQNVPAPKRKRRAKSISVSNSDALPKLRKRKPKLKQNMKQSEVIQNSDDVQLSDSDEKIDWPQKDLAELIKRMELALPDQDNLRFSTRVKKLNWDDIAFKEYLAKDCKRIWFLIQKRVRPVRLLKEVLQDANDWISKQSTQCHQGYKTKRHPDMPKQPLSAYIIFFQKKKDKILAENPGLKMPELSKMVAQMYATISPPEREKYMQLASEERKTYKGKVVEFYRNHPKIPRDVAKVATRKSKETGPKKPLPAFALYYREQLKKFSDSGVDRNTFRNQCKEQWKNMSDTEKVVWIDVALDQEAKYQVDLKNYTSQNPDFSPAALKSVLTKEEKSLKERLAGKPVKPPNSGYGLFSKMMYQMDEIKKVPPKDRVKTIADYWKSSTKAEKKKLQECCSRLMEQYKVDLATYLETLPDDKLQELQNYLPKKRKSKETEDDEPIAKKKKQIFELQPPYPPMSDFSLFSKRYQGKLPVKTAWKNLTNLEKREYEAEVQKLKQKYVKEYEQFLRSLTKEQLIAFCKLKQMQEGTSCNINDIESEESTSCDCASDSESSHDEDATQN